MSQITPCRCGGFGGNAHRRGAKFCRWTTRPIYLRLSDWGSEADGRRASTIVETERRYLLRVLREGGS